MIRSVLNYPADSSVDSSSGTLDWSGVADIKDPDLTYADLNGSTNNAIGTTYYLLGIGFDTNKPPRWSTPKGFKLEFNAYYGASDYGNNQCWLEELKLYSPTADAWSDDLSDLAAMNGTPTTYVYGSDTGLYSFPADIDLFRNPDLELWLSFGFDCKNEDIAIHVDYVRLRLYYEEPHGGLLAI